MPSTPQLSGPVPRYYALRGIGWLTDQLIQFLLPVLAYRITGSLAWSGLALTAQWVPRLLSLPVAGLIADRYPERRVYLANDLVRCLIGLAATGLAVVFRGQSGVLGIAFLLVAGVCCEQVLVVGEKWAGTLVPAAVMHRAQSVLSGIEQGTLLLAPLLGGGLLLLGTLPTVAVIALMFTASLLLTRSLPTGTAAAAPASSAEPGGPGSGRGLGPLLRDMTTGVRNIARIPVLRTVVLATMCVNLMLGLLQGAAPALVSRVYGQDESALGTVYSIAGVAAMAVLTVVPRLIARFGLLSAAVLSVLVQGLSFVALGPAPGIVVFAALTAAFMAGDSVFSVVIRTLRLRAVAGDEFGRTVAAVSLLNFVSLPLAGGLLAALGPHLRLGLLIPLTGAVALAALALLLVKLRALAQADPAMFSASPVESVAAPEPATAS